MSVLGQAAIGVGALLAAWALIELWDAHNRLRALKPPAPASPPVPGTTPGAGPIPVPPAPGPLQDGIYGRLVMTTYFFDTGITVTDDHTRQRRLLDVPPADEWNDGFMTGPTP